MRDLNPAAARHVDYMLSSSLSVYEAALQGLLVQAEQLPQLIRAARRRRP